MIIYFKKTKSSQKSDSWNLIGGRTVRHTVFFQRLQSNCLSFQTGKKGRQEDSKLCDFRAYNSAHLDTDTISLTQIL